MKILITGINGFVGRLLRQSLESKGHDVYGIDVRSSDPKVYAVDITDQTAVMNCLLQISPGFIYHLAAVSQVDYANPAHIYAVNISGIINLLTASVNLKERPNFLFVSSCHVYGIVDDDAQPISENTRIKPINHYGASKAAAEQVTLAFHTVHDLPVAIVRPFNHTGRGQDPHFVIAKIIRAIKDKKEEIELGDLSVIREFLDVRDVVDIYIRLMQKFPDGGIFNIAGGKGYRLSEILKILHGMNKSLPRIRGAESLLRKNEITKLVGDGTAIKQLYKWQPAFSINETLEWMLTE